METETPARESTIWAVWPGVRTCGRQWRRVDNDCGREVDARATGGGMGVVVVGRGRCGGGVVRSSASRSDTMVPQLISTAAPKHAGYLGSLRIDLRLKRRTQSQEG